MSNLTDVRDDADHLSRGGVIEVAFEYDGRYVDGGTVKYRDKNLDAIALDMPDHFVFYPDMSSGSQETTYEWTYEYIEHDGDTTVYYEATDDGPEKVAAVIEGRSTIPF